MARPRPGAQGGGTARPAPAITSAAITPAFMGAARTIGALSARETHRIPMDDLGRPGAVPAPKPDYDRLREQTLAAAKA